MQDTIELEIIVKAPKERVYTAISDPTQIIKWFPDTVEEGTLEVGQSPIFTFTEENHRTRIHVEAATPFTYFAFRWVPGSAGIVGDVLTVPSTLVEFHIEEAERGTKVTLKESGFASLPAEVGEKSLGENSGGWKYMMDRLEELMNQA